MSRRFLFILALVLTASLIGIAAYIRYTWSPVDPLRFRYVGVSASKVPSMVELGFEVENRSGVDITIGLADLSQRIPERPGFPAVTVGPVRHEQQFRSFIVPARETLRCDVAVMDRNAARFNPGHSEVTCLWVSSTRLRAKKFFDWCRETLPEKLHERLPSPVPERTHMPVEFTAPAPAPSSAP